MKLLTQHVARDDFLASANDSPPCRWWNYQSVICIYNWFEMGYRFSLAYFNSVGGMNLENCLVPCLYSKEKQKQKGVRKPLKAIRMIKSNLAITAFLSLETSSYISAFHLVFSAFLKARLS